MIREFNIGSPFITCSNDGSYVYNGVLYKTNVEQVIHSAIELLPRTTNSTLPAGGKIYLGPGTFYITNPIITPYISNAAFNLTLEGCGITASGIVYDGATTQSCMIIGWPSTRNALCFHMRDMYVGSTKNGPTNIIYMRGYNDATLDDSGGGIAEAIIQHCYIGYWNSMTNNNPFTTSNGGDNTVQHNLLGLDIECNYNNLIDIDGCTFAYCATGLVLAGDHCRVANNAFMTCGNRNTTTNLWPTNTPFATGSSIVFKEPARGSFTSNQNKNWDIRNNFFVNCNIHYFSYMPIDLDGNLGWGIGPNGNKWGVINTTRIYNDGDESGVYMAISSGNGMFFEDMKNPSGSNTNPLPSLMMTNKAYFFTQNMTNSTTNTILYLDNARSTYR